MGDVAIAMCVTVHVAMCISWQLPVVTKVYVGNLSATGHHRGWKIVVYQISDNIMIIVVQPRPQSPRAWDPKSRDQHWQNGVMIAALLSRRFTNLLVVFGVSNAAV